MDWPVHILSKGDNSAKTRWNCVFYFFHFYQIWNCCLQTLSVWKSLKSVFCERDNKLIICTILLYIASICESEINWYSTCRDRWLTKKKAIDQRTDRQVNSHISPVRSIGFPWPCIFEFWGSWPPPPNFSKWPPKFVYPLIHIKGVIMTPSTGSWGKTLIWGIIEPLFSTFHECLLCF